MAGRGREREVESMRGSVCVCVCVEFCVVECAASFVCKSLCLGGKSESEEKETERVNEKEAECE